MRNIRLTQTLNVDFSLYAVDIKKHVSIDARKQTRQKMEGISASQF